MGRPRSKMYVVSREAPALGIRSALCEQIDEACRSLRAKPSGAKIHGARKAIKRSRATLKLVRDALPNRTYRLEN